MLEESRRSCIKPSVAGLAYQNSHVCSLKMWGCTWELGHTVMMSRANHPAWPTFRSSACPQTSLILANECWFINDVRQPISTNHSPLISPFDLQIIGTWVDLGPAENTFTFFCNKWWYTSLKKTSVSIFSMIVKYGSCCHQISRRTPKMSSCDP